MVNQIMKNIHGVALFMQELTASVQEIGSSMNVITSESFWLFLLCSQA
ncbi:MAG: hypothetical protein JXO44_10885 [Clostridia bacterium]|nr:hypothetical protein [Clostridia bacterium]